MSKPLPTALLQLRQHIERLEGRPRDAAALPFGVAAIDSRLPGGGLAFGALHEMSGQGGGTVDGAAAAAFAAGIAARAPGKVLWCARPADLFAPGLFAPGLAQSGLSADRVIHVEAPDEKTVLACCEEALRHGGLAAVVGEVSRLSLMASRRLQLAAESTGTLALVVRRWNQPRAAAEFGLPTAAVTRWRVAAAASVPANVPGLARRLMGRPQWRLELLRCKGGNTAEFIVEACDDQGRLALAAAVADRPAAASPESFRAAS